MRPRQVHVSERVWRAVKLAAVKRGVTIDVLCSEIVEAAISEAERKAGSKERKARSQLRRAMGWVW